jgi:hypothetical protein
LVICSSGWQSYDSAGARIEYGFAFEKKLIVINGSKTSKGFALTNQDLLLNTPMGSVINQIPEIAQFQKLGKGYISFQNRIFTWTLLDRDGYISIPPATLAEYSVEPYDKILPGRGSGLTLALLKQGTIIEEAIKHHELELFK